MLSFASSLLWTRCAVVISRGFCTLTFHKSIIFGLLRCKSNNAILDLMVLPRITVVFAVQSVKCFVKFHHVTTTLGGTFVKAMCGGPNDDFWNLEDTCQSNVEDQMMTFETLRDHIDRFANLTSMTWFIFLPLCTIKLVNLRLKALLGRMQICIYDILQVSGFLIEGS